MKSYKDSITIIKERIATLNKHLEVMKKHPPAKIYLLNEDTLLLPHKYVLSSDIRCNQITFTILASNDFGTEKENGQPERYSIRLGHFYEGIFRVKLIPVKVENLSLYVHLKNKSPLFEKILKTGKLPKR